MGLLAAQVGEVTGSLACEADRCMAWREKEEEALYCEEGFSLLLYKEKNECLSFKEMHPVRLQEKISCEKCWHRKVRQIKKGYCGLAGEVK